MSINEIGEVTEENGIRLERLPIHTITPTMDIPGLIGQSIFWSCLLWRSKCGTALTGMVLLGNLAQRTGRPIEWDAEQRARRTRWRSWR